MFFLSFQELHFWRFGRKVQQGVQGVSNIQESVNDLTLAFYTKQTMSLSTEDYYQDIPSFEKTKSIVHSLSANFQVIQRVILIH